MNNQITIDERTEKVTGRTLSEKWNVDALHALYREDGMWYHMLKQFPGVLFDRNGYIRFESKQELMNHPDVQANPDSNTVHITNGISQLIGYVRMQDILQDDSDTDDENDNENENTDTADYGEIDVREDSQTVFEWVRKLDRDLIITDPDFQRNVVWKPLQKSQFIESILLNIPLPPIYVNQNVQGKYILVDGLQRTTTLYEFLRGMFKLSGLEKLTSLNGKSFELLSPSLQTRIEDKKLFVFVIKPSTSLAAIYDIFYRINTGGTQLNRQEIRNCLFLGKSTRFLKSLVESESFSRATSQGISPTRMKDREAALRCIAFANFDYLQIYRGDMDEFLGEIMKEINELKADDGFLKGIYSQFLRVMDQTYSVFGSDNFRPSSANGTGRARINIALMESVYRVFALKGEELLQTTDSNTLRNRYRRLCRDTGFLDAIQRSTGGRQRVLLRLEKAMEILG